MNLERVEIELKKRLKYPYHWGRRQCDEWDRKTKFIYTTYSLKTLLNRLSGADKNLSNYGLNRWYNFWSAMAVESIFCSHPEVKANVNRYDKLIDFSICNIPFDHKTTVFPRGFKQSYGYALEHKKELIEWLYANQSQQGRKHLSNRLFIVLYDSIEGEHWKLKANIALLKEAINAYLKGFAQNKLTQINGSLSDVIWIRR